MGLFLFVLCMQVLFAATLVLSCRNDTDCPEEHSCIDNICKECVKCNLLLRKGESCVVDFNECGDCLEGFEEILLTESSTAIKPCKPIKKQIKLKECIDNNSCPPNNYCIEDSCIKCFDCSLVNRLPPVGKCATGLNDCGSCMNGYHAIAITTDTDAKICDVMLVSPKLSYVAPLGLAVLSFVSVVTIFVIVKRHKDALMNKSTSQNITDILRRPSAPPLYELDAPQIVTEHKGIDLSFIGCERERKQQAKVFKQPDASYYWMEDETADDEARGDQISGTNEDIHSGSFGANRSQSEDGSCSGGILTHSLDGLIINDSTRDSSHQQPNEIIAGGDVFVSDNSVSLDVIDSAQVDEDSVNEMAVTVPIKQSREQQEL